MKKLTSLLVILGIVLFALSCQKPSEKAAGNYTGNYSTAFGTDPGTANLVASGDKTNMTLTCPDVSISSTASGVTTTASGENVSFAYSYTSTVDGDIQAISGTLTGNTLALSYTIRLAGFNVAGTFSGSK